ncbi:MAG: hypothetical protein Q7U47_14045, partial [Paludibacter sp.]|nr:hypothetical protein [Paludibacter sp.]
NFMAQSEFYKLMKADIYPQLNIQLNYFEISSFDKQQISNSVASVNIKIAGVAKHYNIPIISTINRNTVAVNGEKKMTIKDFDLEPPVSMLGLIKVSEWIEIKFKIRCRLTIVQDSLAHQ